MACEQITTLSSLLLLSSSSFSSWPYSTFGSRIHWQFLLAKLVHISWYIGILYQYGHKPLVCILPPPSVTHLYFLSRLVSLVSFNDVEVLTLTPMNFKSCDFEAMFVLCFWYHGTCSYSLTSSWNLMIYNLQDNHPPKNQKKTKPS